MDDQIFEQVDNYISNLLGQEDEVLTNITRNLESQNIRNISVSPNQGKLLQVFALACNAQNVLELGTLAGYSTIWLARAIPDNGKVVTIEFDQHHAQVAQQNIDNAGLAEKIDLRVGKAIDILEQMATDKEGPFDLIFIDADKPPYLDYFKYALKMSRPGTMIICDNVIRNGAVLDEHTTDERVQGVQRLNKFLSTCKEVTATIIQTIGVKEYDGMMIAVVNGNS